MPSGFYVPTLLDVFDATQLAVAPLADTIKVALFTSSHTPDFSSDTAYSTTNEVPDSGAYAAGGATLGTKTFSELVSSRATFDAADVSWAAATISARGALVYDSTVANRALCYIDFGSNQTSISGTFAIQFDVGGIFYFDCH